MRVCTELVGMYTANVASMSAMALKASNGAFELAILRGFCMRLESFELRLSARHYNGMLVALAAAM